MKDFNYLQNVKRTLRGGVKSAPLCTFAKIRHKFCVESSKQSNIKELDK